ncbi:MAG: reverse transcriptase domain-containing protein [Acidobacteria bacterium]|nr:reverse transcriptase domain-containing protein [Acidobacteriota bacterium]
MLSADTNRKLEAIERASRNEVKVKDLSRLMNRPDIWFQAYANIYANEGAVTKGVDNTTMDGFSEDRALNLIKLLKERLYKPKPVRRTYIPKVDGKLRPLGIPSGDDKLVEEVVRIILERIYEPVFSNHSHGFRPKRSCHTALSQIQYWNGAKWLIDFDVQGFFNNVDHKILLSLLEKKIDDRKFINLIKNLLQAGLMEDWKFQKTYSGVPQGAICSPILANVYLHELDQFMEEMKSKFDRGKRRAKNREYANYSHRIACLRKMIDQLKVDEQGNCALILELRNQIREIDKKRKTIPSGDLYDQTYRRLWYQRYADDFLVGIIGSKQEANEILEQVKEFLREKLHLELSEAKTGIRHAKEGTRFLGYDVGIYSGGRIVKTLIGGRHTTRRSTIERINLHVPEEKVKAFCQIKQYGNYDLLKSNHRPGLLNSSEIEIVNTYNAELRGLANYYSLACDVKHKLGRLFYLAHYSLFKTLASKHQSSMSAVIRKLKKGGEFVLEYKARNETRKVKVFKLKHLQLKPVGASDVDVMPNTAKYTQSRTELIERLNAEICEYCGIDTGYFEVHHVRKLSDIKQGKTEWEKLMIARNRKTLVLCVECHRQLTNGVLPSWKRSIYSKVESQMP